MDTGLLSLGLGAKRMELLGRFFRCLESLGITWNHDVLNLARGIPNSLPSHPTKEYTIVCQLLSIGFQHVF